MLGLLPHREPDEAVGLTEIAGDVRKDARCGKNGCHGRVGQSRQSVFGRLGGYDDVNYVGRLSFDPVIAVDRRWSCCYEMGGLDQSDEALRDGGSGHRGKPRHAW